MAIDKIHPTWMSLMAGLVDAKLVVDCRKKISVILTFNNMFHLVALNYQTTDKHTFLNAARFMDNGGCGYVLKPEYMRDSSLTYSPVSPAQLDTKKFPAWKVELVVVSGQHIPRPDGREDGEVIDPYVKVKIRGHPDDQDRGR